MERRDLAVEGETFSYLEHGEAGAPLVLCIHGFPDIPRTYEKLMHQLAEAGYRAVAPWLRGYAPSTLSGPFDMGRVARDLANWSAALSPGKQAAIVGHDWGAVSTYVALDRWPERFCRAVTLAVPHPTAFTENLPKVPGQLRRSWYMGFFQLPRIADKAVARRDFALIDRLWADWSPGYVPSEDYRCELKNCLAASMPAPLGYYRAMPRLPRVPWRKARAGSRRAGGIKVPTLYLHGARDGCIGYEMARGQERFFDAEHRSELLSGVGHFLHLEDPETVGGQILDWLRPHRG